MYFQIVSVLFKYLNCICTFSEGSISYTYPYVTIPSCILVMCHKYILSYLSEACMSVTIQFPTECNVNVNEMYLYSFNMDLFTGFCCPYDELRTNASGGTAIFWLRIYLSWWCCCSCIQSRWSSLYRISWKRPFSFSVLWAAMKRKNTPVCTLECMK